MRINQSPCALPATAGTRIVSSPVVMMARIPCGIPTWEIVVSLAVLYATFMAMVWLAAKIYRVGIFMYGKKPTFKELYKWIRYKY